MPTLPVDSAWDAEMILRWIIMGGTLIALGVAFWGIQRFVKEVDDRFGKGEDRMDSLSEEVGLVNGRLHRLEGEHAARHGEAR